MVKKKITENITVELEKLVHKRTGAIFKRYGIDLEDLLTPLKGKPLVLVIGNYSSGKSTFINELLERDVQRTGQAPTDDCFTVLTLAAEGEDGLEEPGSALVNNHSMPFTLLKPFGERLLAHLKLKKVKADILADMEIIDTPGMLDSVTEKSRGYDYLNVVGELARLADLIILMFDPHKAGTIKETYQAIRSTLPGSTGENRVLYVLNRIDECDNAGDLLKSYGTLCWNLSQMTGRKDIPRIYLTFANGERRIVSDFTIWNKEREELRQAVLAAPKKRINHILEEVERVLRELALQLEALTVYRRNFKERMRPWNRFFFLATLLLAGAGDLGCKFLLGFPEQPLITAILTGSPTTSHLFWPIGAIAVMTTLYSLFLNRIMIPGHIRRSIDNLDELLSFETAYKRDLWQRVREKVADNIADHPVKMLWACHACHRNKVEKFLDKEIAAFFELVQ